MKMISRWIAALALVVTANVWAAVEQPSVEGFDFDYSLDLDKATALVQVFDDGDRTYFQFSTMDKLPTVYVEDSGKRVLAKLESKPPYLISQGVAKKYSLVNGKSTTGVRYIGKRGAEAVPASETDARNEARVVASSSGKKMPAKAKGAATPIERTRVERDDEGGRDEKPVRQQASAKRMDRYVDAEDARAVPKHKAPGKFITGKVLNIPFFENGVSISKHVRDDIAGRTDEISDAGKIVVRGRPSVEGDRSLARARSLAIKNMLVENGVDESAIELATDNDPKAGRTSGFYLSEILLLPYEANMSAGGQAKQVWDLSTKDQTVRDVFEKWSKRANWTLSWELQDGKNIEIIADAKFEGGFEDAVGSVARALQGTDTPIKVVFAEGNRVLRVVEYNKGI